LVGLIVVAIVAALVSTISSALNSLGTVFTMDIWVKRFRPAAGQREIIRLGRLVALVGAVLSIFLALGIGELKDLAMFSLFQSILGFLAPPITAVFLVGVLWRRATAAGAVAVLSVGSLVSLGTGLLYLTSANKQAWPHFLLLSFYLCVALCGMMVAVSLLGPRQQALTGTAARTPVVLLRPERSVVVAWALLVVVMLALYAVFR
jgi:SSS family solute:Na+ symporter